jgi:hypothetical protein
MNYSGVALRANIFAPPDTPPPTTKRHAYYFEDEEGREEVTALCERYLKFLEKMLSDFEQAHQSQ